MKYRTDINSLRAIAVIGVVFFHFRPEWLKGGFIGVDIFFVISGYLMTSVIFRGFSNYDFSLIKFYAARIRRIIPALVMLVIVLLIIGWFILTPIGYKELATHSAGAVGFYSNFLFFEEGGYFSTDSRGKWLLHTWSLSVEWQFYMLFPIALLIMRTLLSIRLLKYTFLLATILAFFLSVWLTQKDSNFSYYMLPARAWEMMVGGLAYLFPFKINKLLSNVIKLLSLIVIIICYFTISKVNAWPGFMAVIPVIAAYFYILTDKSEFKVLTANGLQKIGNWSYSIYLWHWPIVVSIYYFGNNSLVLDILGVVMTVLLGFLSFKYVERFNFSKKVMNYNQLIINKPVLTSSIVFVFALFAVNSEGFINRNSLSSAERALYSNVLSSPKRSKCHTGGDNFLEVSKSCEYFGNKISWAVLGDSHVVELAYALSRELQKTGEGLKHYSFTMCMPKELEKQPTNSCDRWFQSVLNDLNSMEKIENVVIAFRFSAHLFGDNVAAFPELPHLHNDKYRELLLSNFEKVVNIVASYKKKVYVLTPVPELSESIKYSLAKKHGYNEDISEMAATSFNYYLDRNKLALDYLEKMNIPNNVELISVSDIFCDEQMCYSTRNGTPLYFDNDHPSLKGAEKIVNKIITKNN